jgi:heme/copper-type cytochrome/quinol oxidase subunit 3
MLGSQLLHVAAGGFAALWLSLSPRAAAAEHLFVFWTFFSVSWVILFPLLYVL